MPGPFTFLLMRPQLAQNVGISLRALWNSGFTDLRLIDPQHPWPCPEGIKAAAGAGSQWKKICVFKTFEEATTDIGHLFATTVRPRDMVKPVCTLPKLSQELKKIHISTKQKIGFLF